ncbi:MAG: hypothetical protein A2268_03895 [Candidatus Raymondbacteria bacterium RifOxyA12_full_50_37]|uniref:Glycoside hydrolase family 9 domain-containing protein n=1 Tax=Candidatus Raymondbacteria bacterium RIFOXYD12_FULL_49_13 TaxID=1817890 RepID=A0A1F7FAS4_UNCRA|nr:MAG: hypothetical protein A2268_03895 [Candidatus Raymondbacteria bacterium RifOxyA12_full_50_37]OGJ92633.1 MAG: hypothetical protein A2248_06055 [Candidatus Raymondbacteria bacterium RIFOXYA2_FULL_49_16]OGJ97987.1 MAG: hypothetical protein A2453_03080 [Candidatus Raymondbacteria bacterium RIFOXYC2_FULL_50_21]OGJ99851.1 MAG: hypothetical protein A2487_10880 [Candidatus Raymondbacteria bacterium RifOxyC12_full_50_8]OGK03765.1 MAG: hypothetical protein A2519_02120 [Candidatus Raymondbacteria b
MKRRSFIKSLSLSIACPLIAQDGPSRQERIETLTAPQNPNIALNHLGFLPKSKKPVLFRLPDIAPPAEFLLSDMAEPEPNTPPFKLAGPLKAVDCDFGPCLAGDFSGLERPGMYQITIGDLLSVPFFIRHDLWKRTLPEAFKYYYQQRCGVAVPNVHPVCHLDDGRRRDNGAHIDVTGGWHDAGDLRKWMSTALHSGMAIMRMGRNLGDTWNQNGSGLKPILEEIRWGNRYWLKMQDSNGQIWADCAGGINGDNSDNHWTGNIIGTKDDRYINTKIIGSIQAEFVLVQAMIAQLFKDVDPGYAQKCLAAGLRCRAATTPGTKSTHDITWWLLAALELYRATNLKQWADEAAGLGQNLAALQVQEFAGNQKLIRGFWKESPTNKAPLTNAVYSALPAIALLELAGHLPAHPSAASWRTAVQLHLEEYVVPLCARNAFRIIPYGVYYGSPTKDTYRPLAGELTYRYFLPVRKEFW